MKMFIFEGSDPSLTWNQYYIILAPTISLYHTELNNLQYLALLMQIYSLVATLRKLLIGLILYFYSQRRPKG